MTDTRSRHVRVLATGEVHVGPQPWDWSSNVRWARCRADGHDWPCDAIREADRADDLQRSRDHFASEYDAALDRADHFQRLNEMHVALCDKAEAELAEMAASKAEVSEHFHRMLRERDAAREDAERLAEALRDMVPVYHQTGSLRDHADPTDRTGWNVKGVETCEDESCHDALDALAVHEALVSPPPNSDQT
jgi:hypothetical protein